MGSVYQATTDFGGKFVVKELLDLHTTSREKQEAVDAFEREARLLRTLRHPAIPRVVDHFETGGKWYLVMDLVDGEDLADRLARLPRGRVHENATREWIIQLCDVFEYLHNHQPPVIFRDLKPSNIMITSKNEVCLVDFGIAKVFAPQQKGTQIGTPGYAAPEQYHGLATPRSDIFALGATIYHLLTGDSPDNFPPSQIFNGWNWNLVPRQWVRLLINEQSRWKDIEEFCKNIPALSPPVPQTPAPTVHPVAPSPILLPIPKTTKPVILPLAQTGAAGLFNQFLPVPGLGIQMAKYPVTNSEYFQFVRDTRHQPPQNWVNGHIPAGQELHPVTWVSLDDAMAYCQWQNVRLPSGTEWQTTAQGNDQRPWPWGFNFESRGNFDQRQTTPVDWYPDGSGPYGHTDMAGNVWEWTATALPNGKQAVKGGSFYGPQPITNRGEYESKTRNAVIGFRVCK
jgi:serine/threonine protein kinase